MTTRETLVFADEAAWLKAREKDVTSTDVAALFGCSPYLTAFELFHRKAGNVEVTFSGNERTRWGNRLESAIAQGAAEELGLTVEPFKSYMRIAEARMGASFDFITTDRKTLIECKNVDGAQFAKTWLREGDVIEAPAHIEIQIQAQMEVADIDRCFIAALVGGNQLRTVERLRDREVGAIIRAKVEAFWADIAAGRAPAPDFQMDGHTIAKLYANANDDTIDLSGNNRLYALCHEYKAAAADADIASKRKDAAKAEILTLIGQAGKIIVGDYSINATMVQDNPGTLVTPEMIGTYVGGRKGYRNLRIGASKKKVA